MLGRLLDFFRRKPVVPEYSEEACERDYDLKSAGLVRVLGPMHEYVGHAIIPYDIGGPVDMYYFPQSSGTAFATMELLRPDGSGPLPSTIGTYELVAFTRHPVGRGESSPEFQAIELRIRSIFTTIGRYSEQAVLKPLETCEVPAGENEPNYCAIFDDYSRYGPAFTVGDRPHGLLLVVQVHRSEMEYAMEHGTQALIQLLNVRGFFPFSDLDRPTVA